MGASLRVTPQLTLTARLRHDQKSFLRARDYRSTRRDLDLGARYDFPKGFPIGLKASFARTAFKSHWGFLTRGEAKRRDRTRSFRLSVHYRSWTVKGFAPRLSLIRDERSSNAQLQAYGRWRGEIAFIHRF